MALGLAFVLVTSVANKKLSSAIILKIRSRYLDFKPDGYVRRCWKILFGNSGVFSGQRYSSFLSLLKRNAGNFFPLSPFVHVLSKDSCAGFADNITYNDTGLSVAHQFRIFVSSLPLALQ